MSSVKLTREMILFMEKLAEGSSYRNEASAFLKTHEQEIKKFHEENKLSAEEISARAEVLLAEENKKRHVSYSQRCGSRHAGSSTCSGCESREWILTPQEMEFHRKSMIESLEKGWRK